MTVNRNPWPYLIVCMIAITIILLPVLTGVIRAMIERLYQQLVSTDATMYDTSTHIYLTWAIPFSILPGPFSCAYLFPTTLFTIRDI
ncbi:hypothetical protein POKO110462_18840 [Pontibacter korlensis]